MASTAVLRSQNRAAAKGSDPRLATCRGKLQSKRSKLNQEINKELRLRAGAENLFKATNNRKLKETVALELSFVNSNLQLLKEQLAELNSSVEIYQGDSSEPVMPMIALGLKETKEIDFKEPFRDFILEHYSEDGTAYAKSIADFEELRSAMQRPTRDSAGISLLLQYYNCLYFVERRFFPPDRSLPIYFEWYDSLTGVPSSQRTVAFEKASVLFNLSSLHTQLAAKQNRSTTKGLDKSVNHFLKAAGALEYLKENFTNGPSVDLSQNTLSLLIGLMLAQARECLLEKLRLQSKPSRSSDIYFDLSLEAQELSTSYSSLLRSTMGNSTTEFLPPSWTSLMAVKSSFYMGLSCRWTAAGLEGSSESVSGRPQAVSLLESAKSVSELKKSVQFKFLRAAYLSRSVSEHEEAARLQRMCRELRSKSCLTSVLTEGLRKSESLKAALLASVTTSSEAIELIEPARLPGKSQFPLQASHPDFTSVPAPDLFSGLGPLAVFSAKHNWSPPRTIRLIHSRSDLGGNEPPGSYGFAVTTDTPTVVSSVQSNSLAQTGGLKEGDIIVGVNGKDVKWCSHDEVVSLIKATEKKLTLKVVTPEKRKIVKRNKPKLPSEPIASSSPEDKSPSPNRNEFCVRPKWFPFKKSFPKSD